MKPNKAAARLALGALAAAAGGLAAQAAPDDPAQLREQVRALTELVHQMAAHDQAEIQALNAKVDALQAQLARPPAAAPVAAYASAPPAPPPGTAEPRVLQNATGQIVVAGQARELAGAGTALPRVVQNSTHRFALQSADGRYSIGLTGDVQIDTGDYVSFRPDSRFAGTQYLSNGLNARRARIGVAGTAGDFGFGLVWDAGNSQDTTAKGIETAQIIYSGVKGAAFELGYSNTFFTLDQSTSSNDTLFLERATPSNVATNINTGDARSNAGVRLFGERYWVGGYLTGPASGDSHTQVHERFGAFQRVALQALQSKDYTLHLGFGVAELLQATNTGPLTPDTITLSDSPELRIDPTALATTGAIGTAAAPVTGGHVLDLETAANWKNFFYQGEFYRYEIDRKGLADDDFGGLYGQVSWTLTGESHTYNPQAGAYYRIFPAHPFSLRDGGVGAIELAARVSYVDLDSNFRTGYALASQPAAVDGGRQTGYTLGLNWYPNDLFRFLLDYNHIDYDKRNGVVVKGAALGAPIGTRFDAVSLRAQVAF